MDPVVSFSVGRDIPDGSFSGLADTRSLPSSSAAILSVSVALALTPTGPGGFLGDLYATLVHESGGFAVLLNRAGRRTGSSFGYSDDVAVAVSFQDAAPADIHQYRLALNGSHTTPLTETLTGVWQPDGRVEDPTLVLDSDPRTSLLASFVGQDVGGRWTLFVADVSSGGQYRLDSWSLTVTFVPEPTQASAIMGALGLAWALYQRRRARVRTAVLLAAGPGLPTLTGAHANRTPRAAGNHCLPSAAA